MPVVRVPFVRAVDRVAGEGGAPGEPELEGAVGEPPDSPREVSRVSAAAVNPTLSQVDTSEPRISPRRRQTNPGGTCPPGPPTR
jgi:hypothetical protein